VAIPKTKSPWIKDIKIKALDIVDKEFLGNTPPTIFVGSKYIQYKKANVGVLSPIDNKEEAKKYDMIVGARTGKVVKIPFFRKPAKWILRHFAIN